MAQSAVQSLPFWNAPTKETLSNHELEDISSKEAVRLVPTDVLALMMEFIPANVRGVHVRTLLPLSGSWKKVLENAFLVSSVFFVL